MQNYKVEVQNHGESIEAQELFFNLGYSWFHKKFEAIEIKTPETIMCFENGALTTGIRGSAKHKQITLQELRDMVVLKRNDVNDANYEAIGTNFYKGANWYKWDASIGKWIEYVGSYTNLLDSVKPIQKEEVKMKEYLVKNAETGDYFLTRNHSNFVGAIEIPEGANKYIQSIKYPERFGFLRNGSFWDNKWIKHCDKRDDYIVLWQRESLNDKVASAEEYRKSFTHTPKATLDVINNMQNAFEKAQNAINVQNAMAKLFTYPQYLSGVAHGKEFIVKPNQKSGGADHGVEQAQTRELSECDLIDSGKLIIGGLGESFPVGLEHHKFIQPEGFSEGGFIPKQNHGAPVGLLHHGFSGFTQPEELPFIGDELKGVDATLAEREAQYGSFIGVANTTGQLMSVLLNSKNGQTLPYAHQEALHMICSKMARIVNGDHNHLDSWHDIGGYAKLIENNIK